jgi:hypothetical protein
MSKPYDAAAWARSRAAAPVVYFTSKPPPTNVERLQTFIDGHIAIARRKDPISAARHLNSWARFVGQQMEAVGTSRALPHFEGIDAITLANARDRLLAAIGGKQ